MLSIRRDLFKTKIPLCVINYFLEDYGYITLQNENLICADMPSQKGHQDQNGTFTQSPINLPAVYLMPYRHSRLHNSKDKQQATLGNSQL